VPSPTHVYGAQPFFTPGAAETVELISARCGLGDASLLLDVAYGRGEASCRLAARHGCHAIGVDVHPYARACQEGARRRGVGALTSFVAGDGAHLPVREALCDVAICIGAPSIVGSEACIGEMHRALRPGGFLAVSDWVWANSPIPPEAIPPGIPSTPSLEDYADIVRGIGFEVTYAEPLPQRVWDDYYAPLRQNLARMRAEGPTTPHGSIDDELSIFDSGLAAKHWRYAVVLARRLPAQERR